MQRPSSVQLIHHLQKQNDLPTGSIRHPAPLGGFQMVANRAVLRILKHQAVKHPMPLARRKERKRVVHPHRTLASIQKFAKISLAMPALRVSGRLQAIVPDAPVQRVKSLDSIRAAISALPEGSCDKIPSPGGWALHHSPELQFSHAFHGGK